jgi:hypothetical protein
MGVRRVAVSSTDWLDVSGEYTSCSRASCTDGASPQFVKMQRPERRLQFLNDCLLLQRFSKALFEMRGLKPV